MIKKYYEKALDGRKLSADELMELVRQPLEPLRKAADQLRREVCGNSFDLCTITNGKSGRCSEDCKYCAQSLCYQAQVKEYPLISEQQIVEEAAYNHAKGVLRFSVVTSGKQLSDAEVDHLCRAYKKAGAWDISLCASHGLLTGEQFRKLKEAGISRYHNNLETSRRFFPQICTTHTYDEKIKTIKLAREAGLTVCSGGIMGMGETWEDRIELALQLRDLDIQSVPVNLLNPIPGTPLEHEKILTRDEVSRIVAVFRFALPGASIRLAGGRGLLSDKGAEAFCSGANAAISGDMLTTGGISIETDLEMLEKLGFKVVKQHG